MHGIEVKGACLWSRTLSVMSMFLRESLKLNWAMISLWGHKVILYSFQMTASDKGSAVISALSNLKEPQTGWTLVLVI